MLLKFFVAYPYVVYSIIVWGFVLIFIGLKGIKRLWPVSIMSAAMIFGATYWLVSVGLYKFNINFLPVFGIPFFFIFWGAGNGIVFANYLGARMYQKILSILGFSAITIYFEMFVENVKRVGHTGRFNDVYEYVFDVFILSTFAFLITNLFGDRLKKRSH